MSSRSRSLSAQASRTPRATVPLFLSVLPLASGSSRQCLRCLEQTLLSRRPIDARISYRDAVFQGGTIRHQGLIPRADVTLQHHSHNRVAAIATLLNKSLQYGGLLGVILSGLCVRAIDQNAGLEPGCPQQPTAFFDTSGIVIRALATSQYDMSVGISGGPDNSGESILVDTQEGVRVAGRFYSVNRDLEISVGRIFESHWHREPTCHLTVRLRFSGPGANR